MSDMDVRNVKTFLQDDQRWISPETKKDNIAGRGITLEMNLFSRVTFPNGFIPSGLVLAQVTATKRWAPYADATEVAQPGTGVAVLFLYDAVEWDVAFAANGRIPASGLPRGTIVEAFLPTGHGLDANGRADLATNFDFIA